MKKEKIILIGGGGHCHSCIDVIEQEGRFQIAGILDLKEKIGQNVLGYPVVGTDGEIPDFAGRYKNFLVTLGQLKIPELRIKIFRKIQHAGGILPVIVSPRAYVSGYARIGEGTIIMHDALVNANALIGVNCIINSKALVEHDSVIGDHCHISTGALINGGVEVGCQSFVGSGTVTKQMSKIPEKSFIKAHSLIVK